MESSRTIELLPIGRWTYIKRIKLWNEFNAPFVAYTRTPGDKYKMHPEHKDQLERCMNGYSEDEYPHDILDDCILSAIQDSYKNSFVRTSFLMFNVEFEDLQILYHNYNYKRVECTIFVNRLHYNELFQCYIPQESMAIKTFLYFTPRPKMEYLQHEFTFEKEFSNEEWAYLTSLNNANCMQQYKETIGAQ